MGGGCTKDGEITSVFYNSLPLEPLVRLLLEYDTTIEASSHSNCKTRMMCNFVACRQIKVLVSGA